MQKPLRKPYSSRIADREVPAPPPAAPIYEPLRAPVLSREGISWQTNGNVVEIAIEVTNPGPTFTEPAELIVEAALLGAFVPGHPIGRLAVGAMDPGERRRLALAVDFAGMPSINLDWFRRFGLDDRQIELLVTTHWIGNLNVWFDIAPERRVEVHRALDLKVTAGRPAGIAVYLPPRDMQGFEIDLVYNGHGWTAELVSLNDWRTFLIVCASKAGTHSNVALLVKRRTDGYIVPVEFGFEAVEGPGDTLGCVTA